MDKFSCSFLPSHPLPYTTLKLGKHSLDTRVQHYLWGDGRSWACVNWKTPRNASILRRLLMIVARGWEVAPCGMYANEVVTSRRLV